MNENEMIFICQLILSPSLLEKYSARVKSSFFTTKLLGAIYEVMVRMYRGNQNIDANSLYDELKKTVTIDSKTYQDIVYAYGSSANIEYYAGKIIDAYVKNRSRILALQVLDKLNFPANSGEEIIQDISKKSMEIASLLNREGYDVAGDYILEVMNLIEHGIKTGGEIIGVKPHLKNLANITGFRNGEYIIIAARPSIGKTAFMVNLLEHFAIEERIPCGLFTLEMSAKMLEFRMMASITGYSLWGLQNGMYRSKDSIDLIFAAGEKIKNAPLWIDESSSLKISELQIKARDMVRNHGVKLIAVDYISLIDDEQPKIPRFEQMADISRKLKAMAKELDIPILVLSQLVRDAEGRKPTLNSLRETGSIEQDADVVMFLHREREEGDGDVPTELIVAKNRNGPIGTAKLIYKSRLTKFIDDIGGIENVG